MSAVVSVTCLAVGAAGAQECGDADHSGAVTVTDGVLVLRTAAGLPADCDTLCDVDSNGAVTVTDGVNVLRKAAGLAITEQCGSSSANQLEIGARQAISNNPFRNITKIPSGTSAVASAAMAQRSSDLALAEGPSGVASAAQVGDSIACPNGGNQTLTACDVIALASGIASVSTIRFNSCTTLAGSGAVIVQKGIIRETIPGRTSCILYRVSELPFGQEILEERLSFITEIHQPSLTKVETENFALLINYVSLCEGSQGERFASNRRRAQSGSDLVELFFDDVTERYTSTYDDVSFTRLFSSSCNTRTTTFQGGTIRTTDNRLNENFTATYGGGGAGLEYQLAGRSLNISGELTSSCSGTETTFAYRTIDTPTFDLSAADGCPRGGTLEVTAGGVVIGQVEFTSAGGVRATDASGHAIDFASCNDAGLLLNCQ